MKLTKIMLGNKLTKLTNSLWWYSDANRTRKQTHKTHKLTENLDGNKLTKLTEKSKLTFYPATIRRPIAEISNYIRYLFFLCEFVSFTEVQCREEIKKGENIQYRNSRGETHKTQKLTRLLGEILPLSPRAIARHPDRPASGAMSPHPDQEICFTLFGSRLGRKLVAKWRGA